MQTIKAVQMWLIENKWQCVDDEWDIIKPVRLQFLDPTEPKYVRSFKINNVRTIFTIDLEDDSVYLCKIQEDKRGWNWETVLKQTILYSDPKVFEVISNVGKQDDPTVVITERVGVL